MTTLKIALRNIKRQRKRTVLLAGAIAFGVMIMTLVGSLTAGLSSTANETFTRLLGGHIYAAGQEISPTGRQLSIIRNSAPLEEVLSKLDESIEAIQFRSSGSGEIIFGSRTESVVVSGVDWEAETDLVENLELVDGNIGSVTDSRTIIIPEPIRDELGVAVGESVLIRMQSISGQQNVGDFVVGGITPDAGTFGLGSSYVDRGYLNSLIGLNSEQYQRVTIALSDPGQAKRLGTLIENELERLGLIEPEPEEPEPGMGGFPMMARGMVAMQVEAEDRWEGTRFSVNTIDDVMEPVVTIIRILDSVSLGLFLLLLTITMVGLLNTFRMILIERTGEIGTIRAIGMQRTQVRNMFLVEALALAAAGAVAGLAASGVLGLILGSIPMSTTTPLVVFLDGNTFAFPVDIANIVSTVLLLTTITLFSAYLPARKAGRMRPADALRTSY